MSLLLHRPWEKYLNPFLKCPPFIPTTAFWIVCFNKWGDMTLWVWDRKRGWWFLKPLDLGGILHSPHSWKEGYFWLFLSGHNPELRSICSCPSRLATSMLKLVVRVAVIHSTGLITMSWGQDASRGMKKVWCPIWLAASRAGHPGDERERVLERFSPWRKDKTFKLPNKLFKFSLAKNREIKKKKSSTGNKVRLKGYTVIDHQGLYSLGHFAVMLEVSRIPSAYGVQESKSKKRTLFPGDLESEV